MNDFYYVKDSLTLEINENLRNVVDKLKIKEKIEIFTYVLNTKKTIVDGVTIKFFAEKVKMGKSHIQNKNLLEWVNVLRVSSQPLYMT